MLHRLRNAAKSQKGFTLVELTVAMGIICILVLLVGMLMFQLLSVHAMDSTQMKVIRQVDNAVYSIRRDAMMAQTVDLSGGESGPLILSWVQWDNTEVQVTYDIRNNELWRDYSVNGGEPVSDVIAQYVVTETESTNFQYADGVLDFKITASLDGYRPAEETRECQIMLRVQ